MVIRARLNTMINQRMTKLNGFLKFSIGNAETLGQLSLDILKMCNSISNPNIHIGFSTAT